jgi:hypothetical protein
MHPQTMRMVLSGYTDLAIVTLRPQIQDAFRAYKSRLGVGRSRKTRRPLQRSLYR